MTFSLSVPFECPESLTIHLQKVFDGEYDVREFIFPFSVRILDLGANFGSFSVWASHRWPGCVINAYEPHPSNYHGLLKNTAHYPNIKTYNFGIGTPGIRTMGEGLYNPGENSFHLMTNNPNPRRIDLEVKEPLSLPEADIIKLDIEGCEMEVLGPLIGAGRSFKLILLEYHNENLRREIDTLLARDYSLVGSEVQHIAGRGVVKYAHNSILKGLF